MTRQELVNKIAKELNFLSREFNRLSEEKQQKLEEDLRVYYSVIDVEELIAVTVHGIDFPYSRYSAPYNIYLKDYVGLDCCVFWDLVKSENFSSEIGLAYIDSAIDINVERIQYEREYYDEKDDFFASQTLEKLLHLS